MHGIFISYRRNDTAGYAGRIYDALTARFGRNRVFIDIDSIRAGQDFVHVLEQQLAACSVVIVLMGRAWLSSTDPNGVSRLDQPDDFVRLEIATAIRLNKAVIPVLVGGATMPRPEDLPVPLVPLAHLNAVEIFDQLFRESISRLIAELQSSVPPSPGFWRWNRPMPLRLRLGIFAAALLVIVAVAGLLTRQPKPHRADPQLPAPTITDTLVGVDDPASAAPPVKVSVPRDIQELPPVVEASKTVLLPGNSTQISGPAKPGIQSRAKITIGDAGRLLGIAADGTIYYYDWESNAIDALRDGKEQWAYSVPDERGLGRPFGFAADGRLWMGDYCFNSRGEGGHVTNKRLLPEPSRLQPFIAPDQRIFDCRNGQVHTMDSRGKKLWQVDLDGNCTNLDPKIDPQSGSLYVASDARTLYAIAPDGRQLWNVKQACAKSSVDAFPFAGDEVVVACDNQPLYALRNGKPLWTSPVGASGDKTWRDAVFDASGNLYVGSYGPSIQADLISLDNTGKQRWTVSVGSPTMPTPLGFDPSGRLYVQVSETIVTLSAKDQQ